MSIPLGKPFILQKTVWTEADFDQMGWHDVRIHAVAFSVQTAELLMDIDYIFEWVDPVEPDIYHSFWIAPSTLVFSNVHSFTAGIDAGVGLEICNLGRADAGVRRAQSISIVSFDRNARDRA